ncbi:MAG: acyl dehydratase [Azospirillum sp.]|nr:acyl dehydratase [Azospirillum sp.]
MVGPYFDDFSLGDVIETEGATITESQIIDFAFKFDPQPFHIDIEAASRSPFGGLIASGFHTLSLSFRLFRDTGAITGTSMGGGGGDDLRWLRPVRPGDTLRVRVEVLERIPSRRPDRGTVRLGYTTLNQHGEAVMTVIFNHIVARRPGAEG